MSHRKSRLLDLLNRLVWDEAVDPSAYTITYVHRGAPGDVLTIRGDAIAHVGHGYMDLPDDVQVPLHRVQVVRRDGDVIWRRETSATPSTGDEQADESEDREAAERT